MTKKVYTPLILRTGFLFDWRFTVPVFIVIEFVEALLVFLSGAGELWLIFGPGRVLLDGIVFWGAFWVVRSTFVGFDEFFNLLGENLATHPGFKRPQESTPGTKKRGSKTIPVLTDSQDAIKELFISDSQYDGFRTKIVKMVFSRREILWILAVMPLFAVHLFFWLSNPFYWTYAGHYSPGWSEWGLAVGVGVVFFFYIFGITAIRQVLAYFWTSRYLWQERK